MVIFLCFCLPPSWVKVAKQLRDRPVFAQRPRYALLYALVYLGAAGVCKAIGNASESLRVLNDNGFAGFFAGMAYHYMRARPRLSRAVSATIAFGGCTLCEVVQGMDIPFVENHPYVMGSVFDSYDIAAYAVGVGSAVVLDVATERISKYRRHSKTFGSLD